MPVRNTTVTLDSVSFKKLQQQAAKVNMTVEQLIKSIIDRYIDETAARSQKAKAKRAKLVGLGASGESTISSDHDKVLGEAITDEHLR